MSESDPGPVGVIEGVAVGAVSLCSAGKHDVMCHITEAAHYL